MENNESNIKPQSTGGLKLMTVFIAVLALHVLVIGGVTIYHLMSGGDTDLTDNKASKDAKISSDGSVVMDGQLPDAGQTDKAPAQESAPAAPAATASAPAPAPAPAPVAASAPTGPVVTPPPQMTPAPEPAVATEPTTAPSAPVVSSVYVVKMNDTLEKIAHRHHTSMAKLESANGLNGELLHVGQHLVIPGKTAVATIPAADTTGTTILSGTPVTTPEETAAAPAPARAGHHIYTVVKGDTLTRIAHKFRTTTKALMVANNISDPTKLSIGKKLTIPPHEAQAATNVTPSRAPTPTPAAVQPAPAKTTAQLANFVQ